VAVAEKRAKSLGKISEVALDADLRSYGVGTGDKVVKSVLLPLESAGIRLGTLIVCRHEPAYSADELIMLEFVSMIVARELAQAIYQETALEKKKSDVVKSAISTLSYSEREAIIHIFKELDGEEGLLVASKIADRVGITRSVIVNALRKLESAGVIESRSLGMKGTHIRILNSALRDELAGYGKNF
jgi:transcriptional pleiotropic repressor